MESSDPESTPRLNGMSSEDTPIPGLDLHKEFQPGEHLGGCRIEGSLGSGTGGTVYKAVQINLKRTVALKILSQDLLERDKNFVERFYREAQMAAQLVHPSIVQVYDAGVEGSHYYMILEFVDGRSLDTFLENEKSVPVDLCLSLMVPVLEGLAYAHSKGIIHRDIKPANIIIGKDSSVKLMDFGLAKSQESVDLTAAGTILGTPQYMPPEMCNGDPIDFRSDIYSFGATLYHCLAGRAMFPHDSPIQIMLNQMNDDPAPLIDVKPELSASLSEMVGRMIQKEPGQRYQTAKDVLRDLKAFAERESAARGAGSPSIAKPDESPFRIPEQTLFQGRLLGLEGPLKGKKFYLSPETPTHIGRKPENEITIIHQTVSRSHCAIEWNGQAFGLKDLGSSNGCTINGRKVTQADLLPGDKVCVGQVPFRFRVLSAPEDACDTADMLLELGTVPQADLVTELAEFDAQYARNPSLSFCLFLQQRGAIDYAQMDAAEALKNEFERAQHFEFDPGGLPESALPDEKTQKLEKAPDSDEFIEGPGSEFLRETMEMAVPEEADDAGDVQSPEAQDPPLSGTRTLSSGESGLFEEMLDVELEFDEENSALESAPGQDAPGIAGHLPEVLYCAWCGVKITSDQVATGAATLSGQVVHCPRCSRIR